MLHNQSREFHHTIRLDDDKLEDQQIQRDKGVVALLQDTELALYDELLRQHNIDDALFLELNESDLEKIGISSLGHRRKIVQGIERIKMERTQVVQVKEDKRAQEENDKAVSRILWGTGIIACTLGLLLSKPWGLIALFVFAIWIYFAPTLIAFQKGHQYKWAIAIANLFFAATGVVWIILLVFSMMLIKEKEAAALLVTAAARRK